MIYNIFTGFEGVLDLEHFLHIIINQQSRNSDATFKKLLIDLPKYTKNYKIHITDNLEQLEKVILQLKSKLHSDDLVVTVGGDGSLNQTVTFFEKYDLKNKIGYIPSGSGNDFARTHGIPIKTEAAIAHLFEVTESKELSVLEATQGEAILYAVNSLGFGIDGLVNHMINAKGQKKALGPLAYLSGVLSAFSKQEKFSITLKVDDEIRSYDQVQLVLIVNNPYFGGGIKIVPDADGTDDYLEVVVAEDVSASHLFSILPRILTNQSHLSHKNLHTFKGKEVAIFSNSEQYGQKDGEVFNQKGFAYTFKTIKRDFWI